MTQRHCGFALRAAILLACLAPSSALAQSPRAAGPLSLVEVLTSVRGQYPPLLAALIERDLAAGRLQNARGAFDLNLFAKLYGNPNGYYESGTVDVGVEQFTGIWGSTIFGGYRLTRGETLPDYYANRTQGGGEPRLGLSVPLLRDGAIDRRRAALLKARLDQELADPLIARQRLDFVRAASVAYFQWLAAGHRWQLAEDLLRLANDRTAALERQAQSGLLPRIVLTDNRRLVVAREIGVVQARRRFEGAAFALSLFHRSGDEEPVVSDRSRLPRDFPETPAIEAPSDEADLERALARRPELRRLDLALAKLEVDRKLARNQEQPYLDASVAVSRDVGEKFYFDKSELEVQAGIELKVPLQRNEARGRSTEVEAQIEQMATERRFARDRIRTEVRDAFSAFVAARDQLRQTNLNADLALELQSAEEERFRRGAADLLALQIREQAAFDARTLSVDAAAEVFRAAADYRMATAEELTD
jgi:outer membrane protein TolC